MDSNGRNGLFEPHESLIPKHGGYRNLKSFQVAQVVCDVTVHLDYEDFLRQHQLPLWQIQDPHCKSLIARRCKTADEVAQWIKEIDQKESLFHKSQSNTSKLSNSSRYASFSANAALVLIGVATSLLDR